MPEHQITIPSGDCVLAGTLVLPDGDGPFPAALLIAGSGPLDRDGNHPKLPLSVSKDLAEVLRDRGWASLRFDKRGIGESTGEYMPTGLYDEFIDATNALRWLIAHESTDRVVPVGHSVGALAAAEMSAREPDISGAVLLAYTAQDGDTTLRWQAGQIAETLPGWVRAAMKVFFTNVEKQQDKAINRLRNSRKDVARIQGQQVNAKWMREFLEYDPEPVLRMTKTPLLAITGSKDVQVNPDDLEIVGAVAGERATTMLAVDVDHILRHEPAARSNPNKYKHQIEQPIDPSVIDALTQWLGDLGHDPDRASASEEGVDG